jgi:hypothetical protein
VLLLLRDENTSTKSSASGTESKFKVGKAGLPCCDFKRALYRNCTFFSMLVEKEFFQSVVQRITSSQH